MQDLPPPGGFGPISYKRNLPKRGPPGWVLLLGCVGVVGVGGILHYRGRRIYKELDREKRQARLSLLPLLLAESDLAFLQKWKNNQQLEDEIMKNRPEWKSSSAKDNQEIYRPPSFFLTDFIKSG